MSLDTLDPGRSLGIVAIGRNEGERLRLCLSSLRDFELPTVYTDSNSEDDSVSVAQEFGISVVELDPSKPMSAARARREGCQHLLAAHPHLEYVFFVDGDCQVEAAWPQAALDFLHEHSEVGAVCGRRREQHPERSIYNRLCDHEWDTPIGEAMSVGGDAVYRVSAYHEAGEFDPTVPAGEEPELCKRLRGCGWKIWRIDAEMTRHDAAMTSFGQWWKRQIRTGYAGYDVERRFQLGIFNTIIHSAFFWVLRLPALALLLAAIIGSLTNARWASASLAFVMLGVAAQTMRIACRVKSQHHSWLDSIQFGLFTMAAKLPIALGVLRQIISTALGKKARIVEYKSAEKGLHPQS